MTPYLVPIGRVDLKKNMFPSTSYSFLFQIEAAAHLLKPETTTIFVGPLTSMVSSWKPQKIPNETTTLRPLAHSRVLWHKAA